MEDALLVGAAVVVAAVVTSSVLRRWIPETAWLGVATAIAARLLGAGAAAWSVARAISHHLDPLRVAFAVVLSVIGLWMAVIALAMLYVALTRYVAAWPLRHWRKYWRAPVAPLD
jgi:hypothetical protein